MPDDLFFCQCIHNTLDGLRDGLSHFSGPSRVAVIYAIKPSDPVRIYDPQHLLNGHEPRFKEIYLETDQWKTKAPDFESIRYTGQMYPEKNLQLTGLISCGGRSRSVFYQMWFTEHHPDMCSTGPTERWLEHAAWLLSNDCAAKAEHYKGTSGYVLREYSTHAVRDYIVDEMNIRLGWDTSIRVYPILDAVLSISITREEGFWPRGELIFTEPAAIKQMDLMARFPEMERPPLDNHKHVRKLLQAVESNQRKLVSDGKSIIGITTEAASQFCLSADFRGRHGFLSIDDDLICSFSDGNFHSTTHRATLVHLEEELLESRLDSNTQSALLNIVKQLVQSAGAHKHGCTLIIDLNPVPVEIAGQRLEKPVDLTLDSYMELAKSLSKVDGALHIGADSRLHGFACLLDGRFIPGENLARGARYNSALRFSAERKNILVIVVSADRPVSVIQEGVEISAQCVWKPISGCTLTPPTLHDWIESQSATG